MSKERGLGEPVGRELFTVKLGAFSRDALRNALLSEGVQLNPHAESLLNDPKCDAGSGDQIVLTRRAVADLGLVDGGTLPEIYSTAQRQGLLLCPLRTAPYLSLANLHHTQSSGTISSVGHAPDGSVTVASAPVRRDDLYPKGFYLRTVDGQRWLRGYRCDDEHWWSPGDVFVFQVRPASQ